VLLAGFGGVTGLLLIRDLLADASRCLPWNGKC
jgi:hypothetical protein